MMITKEFEHDEHVYLVEADVSVYGGASSYDYDGNRGIYENTIELDDCVIYDENMVDVTEPMLDILESAIYEWIGDYEYGE